MSDEEEDLRVIKEIWSPYEFWIVRAQEILFGRRTEFLKFAFPVLYGVLAVVYFKGFGVYATLFLISLVIYIAAAFFHDAGPVYLNRLFPPDLPLLNPAAPNRTRNMDEFAVFVLKWKKWFRDNFGHMNILQRLFFGGLAVIAASQLARRSTFWVSFWLLHAILYLPWLLTLPAKQYKESIEKGKTIPPPNPPEAEILQTDQ
jgi:hypothetical protein